jgi:hypothetical protein
MGSVTSLAFRLRHPSNMPMNFVDPSGEKEPNPDRTEGY